MQEEEGRARGALWEGGRDTADQETVGVQHVGLARAMAATKTESEKALVLLIEECIKHPEKKAKFVTEGSVEVLLGRTSETREIFSFSLFSHTKTLILTQDSAVAVVWQFRCSLLQRYGFWHTETTR